MPGSVRSFCLEEKHISTETLYKKGILLCHQWKTTKTLFVVCFRSSGMGGIWPLQTSSLPPAFLTTCRVVLLSYMLAEGDKVVSHWTAHGTHQGVLMGIPATAKQVTVTGIRSS